MGDEDELHMQSKFVNQAPYIRPPKVSYPQCMPKTTLPRNSLRSPRRTSPRSPVRSPRRHVETPPESPGAAAEAIEPARPRAPVVTVANSVPTWHQQVGAA